MKRPLGILSLAACKASCQVVSSLRKTQSCNSCSSLSPSSLAHIALFLGNNVLSCLLLHIWGLGEWAFDFPRLEMESLSTLKSSLIYICSVPSSFVLTAHQLPSSPSSHPTVSPHLCFIILHFRLLLFQSNVISVSTAWARRVERRGLPGSSLEWAVALEVLSML